MGQVTVFALYTFAFQEIVSTDRRLGGVVKVSTSRALGARAYMGSISIYTGGSYHTAVLHESRNGFDFRSLLRKTIPVHEKVLQSSLTFLTPPANLPNLSAHAHVYSEVHTAGPSRYRLARGYRA